jgi:RecB family exonuclease
MPKTAATLSIPELRRVYDISKLMAFARDPEGYYLKYIIGLPEDALDLSSGKALENGSHDKPKLNMLRGTIIHALLEKFPFKNKADAKEIIKTLLDNEKSLAQKERESLFSDIQTFWSKMEKHEYIKNFATYKERHSELPFQIAFGHDLLVGRVDACVKDASGNWMVIDFKTGYKNHNEQQMKQLYKIQIESYALFLSLFAPNQNNWEVHIYMPDSELIFKNKYGSSDIKKIRKNLEDLIKSEKDFRKKRGLF